MTHRFAQLKIVLLALVFAALAAGVLLVNGRHNVQQASAYPSYESDCSSCHGARLGDYTNNVTAVPSTLTPAPGAAYTVTITMNASSDGGSRGFWIANSDAAGTTSNPTVVSGNFVGSPVAMTAPATPGTYYYKVFGQSGKVGATGSTGFALYSITVGAAATNTPTNTATSTNTPMVTNTPTATPTSTPSACLPFGQKVSLTIGILRRFGSHVGDHWYKAKYDVNGDGVIDGIDLLQVATTTCRHGHDG